MYKPTLDEHLSGLNLPKLTHILLYFKINLIKLSLLF